MRKETDFLGDLDIPDNALFGIHSARARNNFPDRSVFNNNWYKAIGTVKKACYLTASSFFKEAEKKGLSLSYFQKFDHSILEALIWAAEKVGQGEFYDQFIVPGISGGAGTSINMNVNEIISNAALLKMGRNAGEYSIIDPFEFANLFQSTNDVIPTSLKIAVFSELLELEKAINGLRSQIEILEKDNIHTIRKGYTQMQEAVPVSMGRFFGNFSEALSRDWWRVSKCFERIKVVNLGGSALGTGITVPRYFIMNVVGELQRITRLPVTRAENLTDVTSNLDSLVEVHGILKAHAVNLEKMANDFRLLSSDLMEIPLLQLPQKQVGSSIMPAKVNPVIPEYVISCIHKIYANDQLITSLSASGCLDLNAYLPVIGDALLNSIELLTGCNQTLKTNMVIELKVNKDNFHQTYLKSPSIATVVVPVKGYKNAALLANHMKKNNCDIFQANNELHIVENNLLEKLVSNENLLNQGFSLNDIQ